MSKSRKDSTQCELPFGPSLAGVLDDAASELVRSIRKSSMSREQILDRLAILLGRRPSLDQFNAWTAPSNRNRMPADVLVGLAYILGDHSPVEKLFAPLGIKLADAKYQAFAELGRKGLQRENLDAEIAELKRSVR